MDVAIMAPQHPFENPNRAFQPLRITDKCILSCLTCICKNKLHLDLTKSLLLENYWVKNCPTQPGNPARIVVNHHL